MTHFIEIKKGSYVENLFLFSGEGGIRTRDTVARIQTFQACSFDHSDTSPWFQTGHRNRFGSVNVQFIRELLKPEGKNMLRICHFRALLGTAHRYMYNLNLLGQIIVE